MLRKQSCDVVIMGGGVVGSSIAYHLSNMGCQNIKVIEKDPCYKHSSAMLSAGGVRQQFSVKENIQMSKFGIEFLKDPARLQVTTGVHKDAPDYQLRENGYLFLSSTPGGLAALEENNRTQKACGVTWTHMADPKVLSEKFPWLKTDDLTGGTYGSQNEGYFDPWSLLNALKNKAISQGVEYHEGHVVDAVMMPSTGASLTTQGIKSVIYKSIRHPEGTEISAPIFINAAGPWAGKLVEMLAEKSDKSSRVTALPVKARKRSVFMFNCKPNNPAPVGTTGERSDDSYPSPTVSPLVIDPSGAYFRSEGADGNFICGMSPLEPGNPLANPEDGNYINADGHNILTHDPDCESVETLNTPDHALFEEFIWPALYARVPAFADIKMKSAWAGFYEYNTFDQNAIIGHHPDIPNLVLCNGFSGHGLQQSPAAGRAVAELLTTGKFRSIDLSRFSFERILKNAPIFEQGIV